ncbi:UDP-N-acetylglucosamine 1-carboxyvinyltransferase [Turneriella parva]|uniref:UDP-N-acetylglucosamine 1-carboxyvinyltransferase n=1 Tax=Turneriella parva (strain ATCC BAA-1111 / DSM 21527 / NCTC 11395 / H) TaxID=869212 RepID=I4B6Y2_TURPD|nr:UDP-N-acetylglucosamine 1-carboxyvinyltransferase [Turneriella parva]AFM13039.1 UDP-N-acetylglucosamine 1-carboxyvinyltransferase [Turneriella parva DSM 21527]
MSEFHIIGGHKIGGTITAQGNKNEALPVLCAALMNPAGVTIRNVPQIEDIKNLLKIVEAVGAEITTLADGHSYSIVTKDIKMSELPSELVAGLRGSITLLGPILARAKKVFLPRPGGDKIGRRRVDTHLLALSALGAKVEVFNDGYMLEAAKLKGTAILLDEASVTGTENAIMAAACAEGVTLIENAASEPHVQGLCRFLIAQGVTIEGVGSNMLKIHGVGGFENLKAADHTIGPDYLEIGSFIAMSAMTGGDLVVQDVNPIDLRMIKFVFERVGINWRYHEREGKGIAPSGQIVDLVMKSPYALKIQTDVHGEIPKIDDAPWPMFPADLISIILTVATQCSGTVLIHEKLFESRLYFTDKLMGMGAQIVLCDPHRAVIIGPSKLYGSRMTSPDIRAGMALVIAALAAEGESVIQNIVQVDRGYENIDARLRSLGAKIERI